MAACAAPKTPLRVNVAGVERIGSSSMELRFVAHLRVQNSNDSDLSYSGAFVDIVMRGQSIGSGVSAGGGTVPRYGDTMIDVPVTISQTGAIREATGLYGSPDQLLDYTLRGRLQGTFQELEFQQRGEMAFPIAR